MELGSPPECSATSPPPTGSRAGSIHGKFFDSKRKKAEEQGFTFHVHPEVEFYLLKTIYTQGQRPEATDLGGFFDQAQNDMAPNFRREAMSALESMGISVEFSHHETAPGQQEIDLRHTDALTMSDNIMTLRYLVKQVALRNGVHASFMPKPFVEYAGSGLHSHLSLFEGEYNAFHDPDDEYYLSETAKRFIAGILHHAPEISAVTNQWVNSYKRVMFGAEAPTAATWGMSNRSALIRVPGYSPQKAKTRRIEVRSLDSACNPYLAYAVLLAAGLKGIEEGYELGGAGGRRYRRPDAQGAPCTRLCRPSANTRSGTEKDGKIRACSKHAWGKGV